MFDVLVRLVSVQLRKVTVCFSQATEGKQVLVKPLTCQRDDRSITERQRVNTYTVTTKNRYPHYFISSDTFFTNVQINIFNVLDLVEG